MWFLDLFKKKEVVCKCTQTYNDPQTYKHNEINQYLEDVHIDTSPILDIQLELDKRIVLAIYDSGFNANL